MEPERLDSGRWSEIERLYHAALDRDPWERSAFLQEACGADVVRSEVEELLAYEEESADFIETPALEIVARQEGASDLLGRVRGVLQSELEQSGVEHIQFRLAAGAKLGPYEILSPLGSGGMGEIYRARDSRLGRIVALKILAGRMMDESGNRRRFEREARAISNLNHPNICILYDIGRDKDVDYLVMEYVEGQTLAERLKSGPVAIAELLQIAMEISEALEYAHKCGVIHRDLKPANIMITARGAKLVDFGLARWHQEIEEFAPGPVPGSNLSLSMTGAMMGTPQYMAPEQLARREADARTDIFALGMVIFEMATGRKAFEGATAGDMIRAIQTLEPPKLISLRAEIPAALQELVGRCLNKSPEARWQSAGDLNRELGRIEQATSRDVVRSNSKFRRRMSALAVVMMLAAGAAFRIVNRRTPAAITDQVLYSFTGQNGDGSDPAASVVAGKNGILYGTTHSGGNSGKGTIFELRPPIAPGSAWTETVLYSFTGGSDGSHPWAPLVIGGTGVLYSTTIQGGAFGHGTVFELEPPVTPASNWKQRVLHDFSRKNGDGVSPRPQLAIAKSGRLYGVTTYGGVSVEDGRGTVFELTPPATPGGGWTEKILHRFTGENGDGAYPYGGVVIASDGAIYGTTFGGLPGTGTVYKLTPPATADGDWNETVLHRFGGRDQVGDGASPVADLSMSKNGALYGTTQWGGISGNGTVFELRPSETTRGEWTYTVLHKFTSHIGDGAEPTAGLVGSPDGALYGATLKGGTWGQGVVFKLTPSRGAWIETVLYSFTGHDGDGARPSDCGHLLFDASALYGTTEFGGEANAGTVFKLPL